MTTNIAESVNSMFLDEREYPITALLDAINRRFAEKFHERHIKFINAPIIFVPSIGKDIAKKINLGNKLLVHQTINYKYIVTSHDKVATVDLLAKSCTCKVFDIDKRFDANMVMTMGDAFMSTPLRITKQGWKKVLKKTKGIGESFAMKKNKCSLCKRIGHKRTTCSERNVA
ncbi:hypothetical protein H5410_057628 [Solanum commersonii]|uniref:Uncharacterized protein n=1 Tax=Solanum commersonii TaxID=4109 RepID=A0A9J5WRD1_SOLCO|nr:hypothetical protein H5410_057628 [Solanum commersonii]